MGNPALVLLAGVPARKSVFVLHSPLIDALVKHQFIVRSLDAYAGGGVDVSQNRSVLLGSIEPSKLVQRLSSLISILVALQIAAYYLLLGMPEPFMKPRDFMEGHPGLFNPADHVR